MNIAIPDATFDLAVYVRNHTAGSYKIHITNEQTTKTTIKTVTGTYSNGILTLSDINYPIAEGRFYWLKILTVTGSYEIYKGKLFCTVQTDFPQYKMLDSYFTVIEKPKPSFIVKGDTLPNILYTEDSNIFQMEDGSNIELEH